MPSRRLRTTLTATAACAALAFTMAAAAPHHVQPDATLTLVATIPVGMTPNGLAVNETTDTIYATTVHPPAVYVINGATSTVTTMIRVGDHPRAVAVDPSTNTIYTANEDSGTVSVIDGTTNTVTATIAVGRAPYAVAVDPATSTVYAADTSQATGTAEVMVISGTTNTVVTAISGLTGPLAVDAKTDTLYARDGLGVAVVSGKTSKIAATVNLGVNPRGIAVNSATDTIYAAYQGSAQGNAHKHGVAVLNGKTRILQTMIKLKGRPKAVAVDQVNNTIYVANSAKGLQEISGKTDKVTATAPVGSYVVADDGLTKTLYVDSFRSSQVTVVSS